MNTQRTSQTTTAFNTAQNLFGHVSPKAVAKEPKKDPDCFKAVYPMFNAEAFKLTMDNYRQKVSEYNTSVEWFNVDVCNHNQNVALYLKRKATDLQKKYAEYFPKLNKELSIKAYNAAADKANKENGPIILKKELQTVKPNTELFFQNFIHVYNGQLEKHNKEYIRFGIKTPRPLPPIKINPYFITQLQRAEGVFSLKVCARTVRNHRKRLEEAGVLVNSNFRGQNRAVEVEISPEILFVYDDFTQQITSPENQSLNSSERKEFPYNNDTTRSYKEEYKEENDAVQSFVDKESQATTSSHYKNNFYKSTRSKLQNSPEGAPSENLKKPKTLSDNLREQILHPQELAEQLTNNEYDNHIPIDIRILSKEAMYGTMPNEEYRQLVIQDLFKQSAKMWRNSTPYVGSWKNAINHWLELRFMSNITNSEKVPWHKSTILEKVTEYRWRLENARRWFLKSNVKVKPLYPSDYFDTQRKTSREVGFEFTEKNWKDHLKYTAKLPENKRNKKLAAEERKQRLNDSKKLERVINRFIKEKITLDQLIEYVQHNLPEQYYDELPKTLQQKMATGALPPGINIVIPNNY
ncbi:MAG: hypothetical protein BM557_01160 [Flavobacterium sp. MedPE-SWcel]|uniref:hypothetical protein n=1 Tax=uncultured Flavobacterium sp. TaxID=165435 RepID=UPI00091D3413|nr:hypothetical protein [uncultured Flavobacterium sp.]OIQ22016.1 MAG: hypothetical protein BM557_01160 [Flavobacterium sp. MedPE-SWcel]